MVDFAVHAAALSAEADNRLGDSILYAVDGASGGAYVAMKARIMEAEPTHGFDRTDEMRGGWRLKIAKVHVPAPSLRDRLQCDAILGTAIIYRPVATDPVDAGRYWLIDLQKV